MKIRNCHLRQRAIYGTTGHSSNRIPFGEDADIPDEEAEKLIAAGHAVSVEPGKPKRARRKAEAPSLGGKPDYLVEDA